MWKVSKCILKIIYKSITYALKKEIKNKKVCVCVGGGCKYDQYPEPWYWPTLIHKR